MNRLSRNFFWLVSSIFFYISFHVTAMDLPIVPSPAHGLGAEKSCDRIAKLEEELRKKDEELKKFQIHLGQALIKNRNTIDRCAQELRALNLTHNVAKVKALAKIEHARDRFKSLEQKTKQLYEEKRLWDSDRAYLENVLHNGLGSYISDYEEAKREYKIKKDKLSLESVVQSVEYEKNIYKLAFLVSFYTFLIYFLCNTYSNLESIIQVP